MNENLKIFVDRVAQRRVTLVEDRRAPKIHNTCGLDIYLGKRTCHLRQRSLTMHLKGMRSSKPHRGNIHENQQHTVRRMPLNSMRESFTRAEKYFDIETIKEDKTRKIY